MSSHLGPTQTLELLENLKATVRDFAAKEEKLNQEFRSKTAATRHRRDVMTEELASRLAADLGQAESSYLEAKQAAESKYQQRKLRIAAAHRASKRKALQDIEDREGRRKHKLQTETLQAKRNRETGLANAESTLADFTNSLAQEQQALLDVYMRAVGLG